VEAQAPTELEQIKKTPEFKKIFARAAVSIGTISKIYSQKLTHQTVHGQFITIQLKKPLKLDGYELVSARTMDTLPFPKLITTYLKDKNVSLNLL
jgi:A/G-specific adenine glycosylase